MKLEYIARSAGKLSPPWREVRHRSKHIQLDLGCYEGAPCRLVTAIKIGLESSSWRAAVAASRERPWYLNWPGINDLAWVAAEEDVRAGCAVTSSETTGFATGNALAGETVGCVTRGSNG